MRLLLGVAAAFLLPASASLAYKVDVAGWEIRYFPAAAPTGCIMGGTYQDGTRLSVIVSAQYEWAVGLSNSTWNLKKDATTDVAVYVDRQFIASGKAKHWDQAIAVLPLVGASTFRALQTGLRLDLQTPNGNLNFALHGTGKAMTAVLECVKTLQSPRRPAEQDFQLVSQSEASAILMKLFASAGIQGYRLDPPKSERESVRYSLADGTLGLFSASRGLRTKSADDYAAYSIGRWSELCKGEFISGKQAVPSTDGSVMRKIITTCRKEKDSYVTETIVIRKSSGFLMDLSQIAPTTVGNLNEGRANKDRDALVNAALTMTDY